MGKSMRQRLRNSRGFTLVELTVTMVVVVLAAAVALPSFQSGTNGNQDRIAQSSLLSALFVAKDYYSDDTTASGVAKDPGSFAALNAGEARLRDSSHQWVSVNNGNDVYNSPAVIGVQGNNNNATLCNRSGSGTYFCVTIDAMTGTTTYRQGATAILASNDPGSTTQSIGWGSR